MTHLRIPFYQIDAFSDCVFGGNPAAVCLLGDWPADETMQSIAAENNPLETAFVVRRGDAYDLRWFSHTREVHLCGHATLASGFVVFRHVEPARASVDFNTLSGRLTVRRDGDLLTMDFPAYRLSPVPQPPDALLAGLRAQPWAVFHAVKNYYAVFEREEDIAALQPDMDALATLHPNGVSVTAPGRAVDFVSRFFAPSYGIPEDPVSGHPHCALAPYWADRLGKSPLHARQLSARGGGLMCEPLGDRVRLSGYAAEYLAGEIVVPIGE